MTKRYTFALDKATAEKFDEFVGEGFASEKARDIIIAFLKTKGMTDIENPTVESDELSKLYAKVKDAEFLHEMFTCPITRLASQVGDLPCMQAVLGTEPEFECRDHVCFGTLKRRLGIS